MYHDHFGFDLGFSEYSEGKGKGQHSIKQLLVMSILLVGLRRHSKWRKEWLSDNRHKKFFLFIHTYEPHIPYTRRTFTEGLDPGKIKSNFFNEQIILIRQGKMTLSKSEIQYLEGLYDGGILESDRHVGSFMTFLEKIGLRDSTLVVVTSDHGEEFGEHYPANIADHGHSHHDNQLMVPLIICNPSKTYPAQKISHQVRLMDVMPTVAELLNVPIEYYYKRQKPTSNDGEQGKYRSYCLWSSSKDRTQAEFSSTSRIQVHYSYRSCNKEHLCSSETTTSTISVI